MSKYIGYTAPDGKREVFGRLVSILGYVVVEDFPHSFRRHPSVFAKFFH
jgi:hypothetical protein